MSSVVLAVSLAFGMNVCAAESSTTTNTKASAIMQQEQQHILEKGNGTTTRAAVTTTTSGETVRVAADYSAVSIPNKSTGAGSAAAAGTHKGTVTVYPADTKTYNALQEYVNTVAPGKQVLASGVRFRMYDGKTSIKNGFGTFTAKVGVGAKYNGKTATAYIYAIDGTVTAVPVTIVNGQAVVPMEVMGVVTIVLD